jgi:hypothetical protein
LEGIDKRRARVATAAKAAGAPINRPAIRERVPETENERLTWLKSIYAWRRDWDPLTLAQIFPEESYGKSLQQLRESVLEDIRNDIAHALWEGGEVRISIDNMEHLWKVNRWGSLTRCFSRLVLMNDFPEQFKFGSR